MIACEHVFNLHAWPTERDHPYKERSGSRFMCRLKCTISDGYQMQLSEHHSPTFTEGFTVTLSGL